MFFFGVRGEGGGREGFCFGGRGRETGVRGCLGFLESVCQGFFGEVVLLGRYEGFGEGEEGK